MKYKSKRKWAYLLTLGMIILAGTASWAFYDIINTGVGDILLHFGIENNYVQGGIIVVLVLIIFILAGTGLFKAIEKIIGK